MKVLYLVTDDFFFWSHRRALATAVREAGGEVIVATPQQVALLDALKARQSRIEEAMKRVGNPAKEPLTIDAETRAQLEALGYLGPEPE